MIFFRAARQKSPAHGGALILNFFCRSGIQVRVSSDKSMLNAFCRVAPSVRFKALAIFSAGFLLFARDLRVRISSVFQARRLDVFFAIEQFLL